MLTDILMEVKAGQVYRNLSVPKLVEEAILRNEGRLSETGALVVKTGKYTGRAAKDKFFVDVPSVHDKIAWGSINQPISKDRFDQAYAKVIAYLKGRDLFVFDGFAGADRSAAMKFRVINEMASQNLFVHQLLCRPTEEEKSGFVPDFTIIAVPNLKMEGAKDGVRDDAAVLINLEDRIVLIAGTAYSGEIKKSVFTIMNYFMPQKGILPMHSSANMDPETHDTAIFFGLSGTGKTTLSADPERLLIGDDEHGWTETGIFNFEGGCYAKCIDLSEEKEPDIFRAIRFGSLIENVAADEEGRLDFSDRSLTENTRAGYPIHFIKNAALSGVGGIPKLVIFLTADAFGVLPPISKLKKEAAMYHFISGFTSKVAGTEVGVKEPQPTFSTLFGEPFMPLKAEVYAEMLGEKLDRYGTNVYLINTGWTGGPYGVGNRINLKYTRAMVKAALTGEIEQAQFRHDERFNLEVPVHLDGVPDELMNPRDTWNDGTAYDQQADALADMFERNFAEKYPDIDKAIANAGPRVKKEG